MALINPSGPAIGTSSGTAAAGNDSRFALAIPTHSLDGDFGAVSGTDCTEAFTKAYAALVKGNVLLIPDGTWKLGASGGGIGVADGVKTIGSGRKASIIECNYAGTSRVKMLAPAGDAEFADLGFKMGASVERTAEPQVIFGQTTATRIAVSRCDFLGGFAMCVDTSLDKTTDMWLRDCIFDGEDAGLATKGNRTTAMGIQHNGAGRVVVDNCEFARLGSNATDKPFSSHGMYIAPTATLEASKCRFRGHIQGRSIQFFEGFAEVPPTPIGPSVIRDCLFGAYNEAATAKPFSVCETSEKTFTHYLDNEFAKQGTTSGVTVVVKGPSRFAGTRFAGTSTKPSEYLGDPENEFPLTSSYDAIGAYFNGVKFGEERDSFTGMPNPYVAQTCDSILATNASLPNGNTALLGKVYLAKETTVSKVLVQVTTKGELLTAGKNEMGLYSVKTGELVARTADQSTAWGTAGQQEATLTAEAKQSLTLPIGYYYLGLITNGTVRPTFTRVPIGIGTATTFNAGHPSPTPRAATGNTTSEKLASALGTLTAFSSLIWMALKE
jgi:hypothetical protein